MFLHGSLGHLLGNMLFLYLVGVAVEDALGPAMFLLFYLLGGASSIIAHTLAVPQSTRPCLGASGAIAAVMGAFLVYHARARIRFFWFYMLFFRPRWGTFEARASVILPLWFGLQLLFALLDPGMSSGIAFWAHIGGFVFGWLCALALHRIHPPPRPETELIPPPLPSGRGLPLPVLLQRGKALPQTPGAMLSEHCVASGPTPSETAADAAAEELSAALARGDQTARRRAARRLARLARRPDSRAEALAAIADLARRRQPADLGPELLFLAAQHHEESGDTSEALALLERIAQAPFDEDFRARALLRMARILRTGGDHARVRELLRELQERFPRSPWADDAARELQEV
jgi:hypothetical protein